MNACDGRQGRWCAGRREEVSACKGRKGETRIHVADGRKVMMKCMRWADGREDGNASEAGETGKWKSM